MSLMPSVLASTMVMLLASASAQLVRDAALSQAHWEQQQQAVSRAELRLMQSATGLLQIADEQSGSESGSEQEVHVEQLAVSQSAELGDLPLSIFRISAVGRTSQLSVRLEADYAMDACDGSSEENQDKDKDKVITCTPRIRRIAWRRLEN
jgi:flagellar motor switch/type III secretory pathway protein FliN